MKRFLQIIFIIISFFYSSVVFAEDIALIGTNTEFLKDIKLSPNTILAISREKLSTINKSKYPIIIFSQYTGITEQNITQISQYLKSGGKLILICPENQNEFVTFKNLGKLVGVNIEQIITISEKTDINWVEKTLNNNSLTQNTKIAKVTLSPQTTHLAVFGDIERHESAISLNDNGSVISWSLGKNGSKRFNEKSLQFLIEELLPQQNRKSNFYHSLFDHNERIEKLEEKTSYIENYQDNIINYSSDMSAAQENLELAEINKILASYYHKKNEYKQYEKYIDEAEKYINKATYKTNNLAPAENRGIWFDRGTIVEIKNQKEMGKYFEKLKESGINTVYLETVNAGYTIYPTLVGIQNPLTKGKDPLKWAIEEAHKRNIKIQAWMWIFAVGNDRHNKIIDKKDDYVGPVLEKNMRWALLGPEGNFRPKNQPEFWIDPANKEGRAYLLKLAEEIILNYDVDGIQLDYIRYPFQRTDNLMGFNHNAVEQFSAKTGEKLFNNNYQNNFLWNKWKEENINSFVKQISNKGKSIKPNLKISASVFSKSQQNRLGSIQQNWENWINNATIDSLTPMSYSTNLEALETNLFYLRPQSGACLIYPGIALKHVDESSLMQQIAKIREEGFAGISLFAMAQLDENKSDFMQNGIFSQYSLDTNYSTLDSAVSLLHEYKKMLITAQKITYDLTLEQKKLITALIQKSDWAIYSINNSQLNNGTKIINEMENETETLFKDFSKYNPQRKQTALSYLKRASNLIKISTDN